MLALLQQLVRQRLQRRRHEHRALLEAALGTSHDISGHLAANRAILRDAEQAAERSARLREPVRNPHCRGTRAFVLWETEYQRVLIELTDDRLPARYQRRARRSADPVKVAASQLR